MRAASGGSEVLSFSFAELEAEILFTPVGNTVFELRVHISPYSPVSYIAATGGKQKRNEDERDALGASA